MFQLMSCNLYEKKLAFLVVCLVLGLAVFGTSYTVLGQESLTSDELVDDTALINAVNKYSQDLDMWLALFKAETAGHRGPLTEHQRDIVKHLMLPPPYEQWGGGCVDLQYVHLYTLIDSTGIVRISGQASYDSEAKNGWRVTSGNISGDYGQIAGSSVYPSPDGARIHVRLKDRYSLGNRCNWHGHYSGKVQATCRKGNKSMTQERAWTLFREYDEGLIYP